MDKYEKYLIEQRKKRKKEDEEELERWNRENSDKQIGEDRMPIVQTTKVTGNSITTTGVEKKPLWEEFLEGYLTKGAMDRGVNAGNVAKTILGTGFDIIGDAKDSLFNMGETAIDAGATAIGNLLSDDKKEKVTEFVKRDLISEYASDFDIMSKLPGAITSKGAITAEEINRSFGITNEDIREGIERNSILGEKSDALVQSAAQLGATIGLQGMGIPWWMTTGVTSFGSGAEEALNEDEDTTLGEATGYGLVRAAADTLTEKLTGGISFGSKTLLGDGVKETLTKNITNKALKTVAKYGLDMAGEGVEEIVAEAIGNAGKAVYKDDKTIRELVFSEEAFEQYLDSFIGGALISGGANVEKAVRSVKSGRDYDSGLSDNEQKVLEAEINKRVTKRQTEQAENKRKHEQEDAVKKAIEEHEAEYGPASEGTKKLLTEKALQEFEGKELDLDSFKPTKKELKEIRERVDDDLRKGYIDISTIEETLMGDSVNKIRELEDRKANASKPADIQAIEAELNQVKKSGYEQMKNILRDDHVLKETYKQRMLQDQDFVYEENGKDSEITKELAKSATKAKLGNDRRSHELFDFANNIANDLAKDGKLGVKFVNNEILKTMKGDENYADLEQVDDVSKINGCVVTLKDGTENLLINVDSKDALNVVTGHETTHLFEGTNEYDSLSTIIEDFATEKGIWNEYVENYTSRYKGIIDASTEEGKAKIKREVVAQLCGEYVLTDEQFVKNLSAKDPNIFKRVYENIKHMVKMATAGSAEERKLLQAKRMFEKAYREAGSVNNQNVIKASDASKFDIAERYSLESEEGITYKTLIQKPDMDISRVEVSVEEISTKTRTEIVNEARLNLEKKVGKDEKGVIRIHNDDMGKDIVVGKPGLEHGLDRNYEYTAIVSMHLDTYLKNAIKVNEAKADEKRKHDSDILLGYGETEAGERIPAYFVVSKLTTGQTELIEFGSLYSIRAKKIAEDSAQGSPDFQSRTSAKISISELLDIVNEMYSDILPKTVAEHYGNTRRQTKLGDSVKYSISDTKGRKLTKGQQEYFKDSKARDENGAIKTVYHGTNSAGFTVFNRNQNWYTDNEEIAGTYTNKGGVYEGYLNIKNPLVVDVNGERWSRIDVDQVDPAIRELFEEYGVSTFEEDGAERTSTADIVGVVEDGIDDGIFSYDGVIFENIYDEGTYGNMPAGTVMSNVYVTFNSNQFKNVDNKTPTSDPDIRFSISEEELERFSEISETKLKDSKIRMENGSLRKVYHGTNSDDFTVFNSDFNGMGSGDSGYFGKGFYFAFSEGEAGFYGKNVKEVYLNIKNPFYFNEELHHYNNQKTYEYGADRAVFVTNFADKFPELAKNMTVSVWKDGDEYDTELTFKEFADQFKSIVNNKTFIVNEVENSFGEKEYVALADEETHTYTDYKGDEHSYKDYKYEKRFYDEKSARDQLANAYLYMETVMYDSIDLPPSASVIMETEFSEALKQRGYDGVMQSKNGDEIVAFYPEQIKLADKETFDDEGNLIPISERFNEKSPDIRYSLSNKDGLEIYNQTLPAGSYEVYGRDVKQRSTFDDIAPVAEPAVSKKETVDEDIAPVAGNDVWEADPSMFEETPEEPIADYNDTTVPMDKESMRLLTKNMKEVLGLNQTQRSILKDVIQDYSTGKIATPNDLYNAIADKFGVQNYEYMNEELQGVKKALRETKMFVSDELKDNITDYFKFRQQNFGKLRIASDGMPVDVLYETLSEVYPGHFPADIINPADQLYRMEEVANMDASIREEYVLPDEKITEATDFIRESVMEYKRVQRLKDSLRKEPSDKPLSRKELRRSLLSGNEDFIINAMEDAKNLPIALMNNTDTVRVTEMVFGRDKGKKINELVFQKAIDNEARSVYWQNKQRADIKALGIKPKSKMSAAVQKYGEGEYMNEYGDLVKYGDEELEREFPNKDDQAKIRNAAEVIRRKYDEYIDKANAVLTKQGFDPIPKIDNYMRHFEVLNDVFSKNGIPFNPQSMAEHNLPTDINGLTEFWSPQKQFFANALPRKGKRTTLDAIQGVDGYIGGIANLIYHTEDIQRGRALEDMTRETFGEEHGWDNAENLPDELKAERLEKIQNNHLSNYAAWVHEWTNNMAGKKNKVDRSVEAVFGRRAFAFLDQARKQVGSNMIGFNLSSSLTNFIAPVQAASKTSKLALARGTADTVRNIFKKDGFADKNAFLTSRMGTDMLTKTPWSRVTDAGFIFMKGADWFTSNQIVRSKYHELIAKGRTEQQAHAEAGQFAARIMGDRTKGAQPALYNSKLIGLATQFQLEVNNQLYSMFYDTYHESKESAKGSALKAAAGMTFVLGQLAAYTHVFGQTFEAVAGYNPTFDFIEIIKTALGWGDDDEEKTTMDRLKESADMLVDALPYVNLFSGGGRIPVASGIPNLIGVATGGTDQYGNELTLKDEAKKLLYLVPPTGGNQVKKTYNGLKMFDEDLPIAGSYTNSGGLRFPVEKTIPNMIQAGLFGQWANENAGEYFDREEAPLKEKQIQEFKELDIPISDYWTIREDLADYEANGSKVDYISELDLPISKKNLLANNVLDRKEKVDLTNYDDYGSFEEFDFAIKNPEKYPFAKAVGGIGSYETYSKQLNEIKADKDENGKSISGSRKAKVIDYINNLDADYGTKIILYKSEYNSDDSFNSDIINYLGSRDDLNEQEIRTILEGIGFTVDENGIVRW